MTRRILIGAVIAGALAGAAGAAVQAQEPAAQPPPAATPTPAAVPVETAVPYGRLPDGRYDTSFSQYRVQGAHIAVQSDDPAGGPPWAVKVFDAERIVLERPARTLAEGRVVARERCVQLGRLQGTDFGWVFGDGRFRRTAIEDQLLQCTARKNPKPIGRFASPLAIVDPAAPKIISSVVWGLMPGASAVTIAGMGAGDGAAVSADGAFLRVTGPDARPTVDARVEGGGKTVRLAPGGLPSHITSHLRFPTLVPGSERLEAPAPDPAGGPRWAVRVVQTREGVPCVPGPTRVVDGRGGGADLRLGLFTETVLTGQSCRPLETRPAADRPCDWGSGFGNESDLERDDAFLERARTERRLLAGTTTFYAQCSADVERVTLATPRDIRALVPSAAGHAILAVYDGDFVAGNLIFTAHLKGGGTWKQELTLGF